MAKAPYWVVTSKKFNNDGALIYQELCNTVNGYSNIVEFSSHSLVRLVQRKGYLFVVQDIVMHLFETGAINEVSVGEEIIIRSLDEKIVLVLVLSNITKYDTVVKVLTFFVKESIENYFGHENQNVFDLCAEDGEYVCECVASNSSKVAV